MARLSIWNNGIRGKDYRFFDRTISEFFGASGTGLYVHLYKGVYDQTESGIANSSIMDGGILAIQDTLLLENRDRAYEPIVRELRGIYNVNDIDFNLSQFGLMLTNDTIFIEIHLNDMVASCGRRIISGDVIELPHRRDDQKPEDGVPINAFYVVEDASWASDGYSATWFQHIWRIKCAPMTASQEFSDILNKQASDPLGLNDLGTLGDIMSTIAVENNINNAVVDAARANFVHRNFETQQFWIMPGDQVGNMNPWIFAGDGIPPNGEGKLLQSGTSFPLNAAIGDWFLRTDYSPSTLFLKIQSGWQIQEVNYRQQEWTAAHRLLYDFINSNSTFTLNDGTVQNTRQYLSNAVTARADY